MSFGCTVCLALEHASEDSLRALVVEQARQIDRLLGGGYAIPATDALAALAEDTPLPSMPEPPADLLSVLVDLMNAEDIFRRPGRVAAPRLLERLNAAGFHLTPCKENP